MRLALTNAEFKAGDHETKKTTQVKAYIMSYLLPFIINKSLKFLNADLTAVYLLLIQQAMQIEGHLRDYGQIKMKHMTLIQKLHSELLECKGVIFNIDHIAAYEDHFISFLDTFKNIKSEKHKQDGFRILREYLKLLYKQVFSPITDIKFKERLLMSTVFFREITEVLVNNLTDYHDSVKEEAQLLLICIT